MKQIIWLSFLIFGFAVAGFSQTNESNGYQDVVYLKNGSVMKGQIQKYEIGKEMQLKTVTGFEMTIPADLIDKIEQIEINPGKVRKPSDEKPPVPLKTKGMYYSIDFGPTFNSARVGMDVRFSTGYMFHHLLGFGVGAGYDNYGIDSYSPIFPFYGEVRGYFIPRSFTPFYSVKMGYGIAGKGRTDGADKQVGGTFFHPQVGLRFLNKGKLLHCALAAGVKWQYATYTYIGSWPEQTIRDYRHLSSTLTFSLIF